jgi:predicted deacylase
MKFTVFLALVFAWCGTVPAADLTVGTATASSGRKATGFLRVPAAADPATDIPVIVVNGAKRGPVLALVAGSHGTEYASILALQKLAQAAEPSEIAGALIIVPMVNLVSFAQKVPHVNPVDGKNMNRFFPGIRDGSQTERASWAIAKQVVERCDYLIDLHGGDLDENLRRYAYWANTGNAALDAASRANGAGVWARPHHPARLSAIRPERFSPGRHHEPQPLCREPRQACRDRRSWPRRHHRCR